MLFLVITKHYTKFMVNCVVFFIHYNIWYYSLKVPKQLQKLRILDNIVGRPTIFLGKNSSKLDGAVDKKLWGSLKQSPAKFEPNLFELCLPVIWE